VKGWAREGRKDTAGYRQPKVNHRDEHRPC
jgi:hypothetical protein